MTTTIPEQFRNFVDVPLLSMLLQRTALAGYSEIAPPMPHGYYQGGRH